MPIHDGTVCLRESAPLGTERVVAQFEIPYRNYLDPSGVVLGKLPDFARNAETMTALYRAMVLTRTFDIKAVSLQRTGQLGTYPSCLGQEAVSVGFGSAMRPEDVMLTTYREQGAQLWRGVSMVEILRYWGGDTGGNDYQHCREDFPVCVPIGSHAPHAVGVATAFKLRGEPRVAVCALGDGGTAKGDFYEAINLAGVWHLPVVFIAINNQWAISVPRHKQTAAETLAQKSVAAGFPGMQVDGNDVVAVHEAAIEAIERARAGGGPTLIEAVTYRLGDHTTADDARRYRNEEEVSAAWKREPLARLRAYLGNQGWWTKQDEADWLTDCKAEVEAAVAQYLAIDSPSPNDMFDRLFETLPSALEWQRRKFTGGSDD